MLCAKFDYAENNHKRRDAERAKDGRTLEENERVVAEEVADDDRADPKR